MSIRGRPPGCLRDRSSSRVCGPLPGAASAPPALLDETPQAGIGGREPPVFRRVCRNPLRPNLVFLRPAIRLAHRFERLLINQCRVVPVGQAGRSHGQGHRTRLGTYRIHLLSHRQVEIPKRNQVQRDDDRRCVANRSRPGRRLPVRWSGGIGGEAAETQNHYACQVGQGEREHRTKAVPRHVQAEGEGPGAAPSGPHRRGPVAKRLQPTEPAAASASTGVRHTPAPEPPATGKRPDSQSTTKRKSSGDSSQSKSVSPDPSALQTLRGLPRSRRQGGGIAGSANPLAGPSHTGRPPRVWLPAAVPGFGPRDARRFPATLVCTRGTVASEALDDRLIHSNAAAANAAAKEARDRHCSRRSSPCTPLSTRVRSVGGGSVTPPPQQIFQVAGGGSQWFVVHRFTSCDSSLRAMTSARLPTRPSASAANGPGRSVSAAAVLGLIPSTVAI